MQVNNNHLTRLASLLLGLSFVSGSLYAAEPVDLSHQPIAILQAMTVTSAISAPTIAGIGIQEIKRSVDFNKTLHVRVQQTYMGYPVWGGDAVLHIKQGDKTGRSIANVMQAASNHSSSMNGVIYKNIKPDLMDAPQYIFSVEQAKKAFDIAVADHRREVGATVSAKLESNQLIVYIDDKNKAHWAYHVIFSAGEAPSEKIPAKPSYIIDAVSLDTYVKWNEIKSLEEAALTDVLGGGFGGNKKTGKLTYDGLANHLPGLKIKRDASNNLCYFRNEEVLVQTCTGKSSCGDIIDFKVACNKTDPKHNNVYWNGEQDAINGAYSPSNDALFSASITKELYAKWYDLPVLVDEKNQPMLLTMVIHLPKYENAYWNGYAMYFGDGENTFYPLVSLGVTAHEISHGFTQQHADLVYYGQSGGMNEAFSDMAAQAAEFYAYGENKWEIGSEIFKAENEALRYMDQPSKDCDGREPGDYCSIDHVSQYSSGLDVHFSSGIYNHVFYLMSTAPGWNTKKAFDIMVKANQHYWTSTTNFVKGACGVLHAANDYQYDAEAVKNAFKQVGIDTENC